MQEMPLEAANKSLWPLFTDRAKWLCILLCHSFATLSIQSNDAQARGSRLFRRSW